MRRSEFFIKTLKENPRDEASFGMKFLVRAGFVRRMGAGIYSFLPFGLIVLRKIEDIIRGELLSLGAFEILMPALHPKNFWEETGRWHNFDAMFKTKSREGQEFGLGPTNEETVAPLMKNFIQSYKDLPIAVFQIQTKFRDELRPKSGLLRGREFLMKDLYSFHASEKDAEDYYERTAAVYERIFKKCGVKTLRTKASGGTFCEYSDEFQAISEVGEDTIYLCQTCNAAINKEFFAEKEKNCPDCGNKKFDISKGIEIGNIFKLKTKYSKPFNLCFKDKDGSSKLAIMNCYGIGISRLMAAISEILSDNKGLIWPEDIAPFRIHLLNLAKNEKWADRIYSDLLKIGVKVLYDDRKNIGSGEKLVEADLFGAPLRAVASDKTIKQDKIEIKKRNEEKMDLLSREELFRLLKEKKYAE